jgi:hypothetical protein
MFGLNKQGSSLLKQIPQKMHYGVLILLWYRHLAFDLNSVDTVLRARKDKRGREATKRNLSDYTIESE